jgi:hypothetical protein
LLLVPSFRTQQIITTTKTAIVVRHPLHGSLLDLRHLVPSSNLNKVALALVKIARPDD